MKEYTSEEKYKRYEQAVYRTKSGLADFDKDIYVPMFGYKDVMDYYKQASLDRLLDKIAVPTLTLDGRDDMICDQSVIPTSLISAEGSNIIAASTKCGAHACHMSGWLMP